MATVTSFEALAFPSKSELRQFAELFTPLFHASTEEARRQAVAALSQCPNVPGAVALFIASQPISIAAPFLVSSPCLSDDLLIMIARTQGAAHARAIVRRDQLSPTVIDALVGLRHGEPARTAAPAAEAETKAEAMARTTARTAASDRAAPATTATAPAATPKPGKTAGSAAPSPAQAAAETAAAAATMSAAEREEQLRDQIRRLAAHVNRPTSDRLGLRTVTAMQAALLVRFARNREGAHFATTLADILSSSRWLAERILLDISGRQLATTLLGVGMEAAEAVFVLERLYPHLAKPAPGSTRAEQLWNGLNAVECEERIETWRRADSYTFQPEQEPAALAPANTPAPTLVPSSDTRSRPVLRHRMR
ncbi:hypothetical protein C0075_17325 [Rhizobium sp. KAs_5_22]|uniref:DUF2336 domain-containing protein n=1 Tax=Ciceribacter selenitireducens TaxID=448181 RepID=UPI000CEA6453|nr:hypothetical protein C0075_17325 [Rhizobium sp. KAs_5_22]